MNTLADIYHKYKNIVTESVKKNIGQSTKEKIVSKADDIISNPFDIIGDFILEHGKLNMESFCGGMWNLHFPHYLSIGKTFHFNRFDGYYISSFTYLPEMNFLQICLDGGGGPVITKNEKTGKLEVSETTENKRELSISEYKYLAEIANKLSLTQISESVGRNISHSRINDVQSKADDTFIDYKELIFNYIHREKFYGYNGYTYRNFRIEFYNIWKDKEMLKNNEIEIPTFHFPNPFDINVEYLAHIQLGNYEQRNNPESLTKDDLNFYISWDNTRWAHDPKTSSEILHFFRASLTNDDYKMIYNTLIEKFGKINESVGRNIQSTNQSTITDQSEKATGVYYQNQISKYPRIIQDVANALLENFWGDLKSNLSNDEESLLENPEQAKKDFMNTNINNLKYEMDVENTLKIIYEYVDDVEDFLCDVKRDDFFDEIQDYLDTKFEDENLLMGGRYENEREMDKEILKCFLLKIQHSIAIGKL